MSLHGQHLIAGRVRAAAAPSFHGIDATSQATLVPGFAEATPSEISEAVYAAAAVAAEFAATSGEQRAALLERIATEIEGLGDALLQRAHQETALPLARLTGERARTCGQLRLFAAVARDGSWVDARIDPAQPQRQPLPRADLRRMLRPLGPVAVFGASNFPFAFSVAGGDTASALATGNPVIAKAHPAHPGTSELAGEAIRRAVAACALPAGLFSLLQGRAPATSLALVTHPALAAVGFTGSHQAGRALFDAAAARPRPIPVFAEMSSVNPLVVLPGALRERGSALAEGLKNSFTLGLGQFCTKPGLVFGLASPEWDAFAATLAALTRAVPKGTFLHAGIAGAFTRGLDGLPGVEWLARDTAAVGRVSSAHFRSQPALAHECFGPYTLLVTCASLDDLSASMATLPGQLTATVHGQPDDLASAGSLLRQLEALAGRLVLNGFPTGVEVGHAMQHGGPYPASTDARFTSVGSAALARFVRPVCYQDFPDALRPDALKDANPLHLLRLIDGQPSRARVGGA